MYDLLKGWDMVLSVSPQRLSRLDLDLEFNDQLNIFEKQVVVNGKLNCMNVKILNMGNDMIQLNISMQGNIVYEGRHVAIDQTFLQIVTNYKTIKKQDCFIVVPEFGDMTSFQVMAPDLGKYNREILDFYFSHIFKFNTEDFILLQFNQQMKTGKGMVFESVQLTSTFAAYSPEYSSLALLLSREKNKHMNSLDPHILPSGEESVLRVSNAFLREVLGEENFNSLKSQHSFCQKPMNAQIFNFNLQIQEYLKMIVDHITLPEQVFQFESVQVLENDTLFSATEKSINELKMVNAIDKTTNENKVQKQAEEFFKQAILYYTKPSYRKVFYKMDKVNLPQEIIDFTQLNKEWYEKYARLQLMNCIIENNKGIAKKLKVNDEKVKNQLKEMSKTNMMVMQMEKLYALSYCVIYPRIALYLEEKEKWGNIYKTYLESDEFIDKIIHSNNVNETYHEALCKLSIFSDENQSDISKTIGDKVIYKLANMHCKAIVKEYPEEFKECLNHALAEVEKKAQEEDDEVIKGVLESAGGTTELFLGIMSELTRTAVQDGYNTIDEELHGLERFWHDHPQVMEIGLKICSGVVSIITIALFAWKGHELLENDGKSKVEKGKNIFTYITSLIGSIWAAMTIVGIAVSFIPGAVEFFKTALTSLGSLGAKTVSFLSANIAGIIGGVAIFFAVIAVIVNIWDAYDDFANGHIASGILSSAMALMGILTGIGIVLSWSGVTVVAIAIVGFVLAIVKLIINLTDKKQKETEKQLNNLSKEVKLDLEGA